MTNWLRTLDIKELWQKAEYREIEAFEFAAELSQKLARLNPFRGLNEHLEIDKTDLVKLFAEFAESRETSWDKIDSLLTELYDWADSRAVGGNCCWIEK